MIRLVPSSGGSKVPARVNAKLPKLQIHRTLAGRQAPDRHPMGAGHCPVDAPIELISALDRGSPA